MKFKFYFTIFFITLVYAVSINSQSVFFTDVASSKGINSAIQFIRGSVSFCDFNSDGLDDLSFSSAQQFPLYIFKNEGTTFTDVTSALQLTDSLRSMNLLWADYDNDGDKDLFCAVDYESTYSRLYRNDNGVMVDVTVQSGIGTVPSSCNAAAFADYNNDGFLDLFVTHYSEFTANFLYKNNGDGTFTDVTEAAGVTGIDSTSGIYRLPLAVVFYDYNNNGLLDLHVCNDHFTGDLFYENNGDGTFTEIGEASGADVSGFMMGIAVGDYDENGFLDLYLSNDPFGNYLLKNNGDGTFTDVAESLGLTVNKSCWGNSFFDYDNDGDLDLYVCVEVGVNAFFRNNGDNTFTRLIGIGLDADNKSFGCAIGDFDNNGYYDLAVHNEQSLPHLYQNSGTMNNWLKFNLTGVECNRDAIGSRIELFVQGRKLIRELTCGISYMSQNSNTVIIGVGSNTTVDSVLIKWAGSGTVDVLRSVDVNQTLSITEGETIVGVEDESTAPTEFILEQNYPNPFNPGTRISWQSPVGGHQSLKIYDALGNEVATLVDEYKPAGSYEVDFSAKDLSSGIYLYKLQSGNLVQTRKMILIK